MNIGFMNWEKKKRPSANVERVVNTVAEVLGKEREDVLPYNKRPCTASRMAVYVLRELYNEDVAELAEAFEVSEQKISDVVDAVKEKLNNHSARYEVAIGTIESLLRLNAVEDASESSPDVIAVLGSDTIEDAPEYSIDEILAQHSDSFALESDPDVVGASDDYVIEAEDERVVGKVISSRVRDGILLDLGERGTGWLKPQAVSDDSKWRRLVKTWTAGKTMELGVSGEDSRTGRVLLHLVSKPRIAKSKANPPPVLPSDPVVALDSFDYVCIDAANIVGMMQTDAQRAAVLPAIANAFESMDKHCVFFVETSMLAHAKRKWPEAYDALNKFALDDTKCVRCEKSNGGDLDFIHFLSRNLRAIGLTRDRFLDHKLSDETRSRIHPMTFIGSIPGLKPTLQLTWLGPDGLDIQIG